MKERLTGAIILVALIVLLVPELLTGPARPPSAAAASASEEPPLRSYTINLADDAHSRTAAAGNGPEMPQPSGPEQPTPAQSVPPPSASAATPTSPPASVSAATSASGPPATTVRPDESAHPQSSQRAASRTAAAPDKPKARAVAAGGGWMVQLGVFASRQNAEHLAQEMRGKGFKASVSDVTGSSRKLYRVRVGPTADRAAAQELQARLRAAGRPGTVVPYS